MIRILLVCAACTLAFAQGTAARSADASNQAQSQGHPWPESQREAETQDRAPSPQTAQNASPQVAKVTYTITVTFNYDFELTHACSAGITRNCVQQFGIYDISRGASNAFLLGTVPLPTMLRGTVVITGTTPPLPFQPGNHLISVAAVGPPPNSQESSFTSCTTWVVIP